MTRGSRKRVSQLAIRASRSARRRPIRQRRPRRRPRLSTAQATAATIKTIWPLPVLDGASSDASVIR